MGPARREVRWRPGRRRRLRSRVPLRRQLRQDPAAVRYWLLVAAVALVLASVVGHAIERADRAQRSWGRTATVYVVTRPIRAGGLVAGSVRSERWPAGLVPERAITREPRTGRAAVVLEPGTALTRSSLEPPGPDRNRRTIAVALPDAHLPVRAGDRVDVWATADPSTVADGDAATRRVATAAQVVSTESSSVVVAVAPGQVAEVTHAAATATITLVGTRGP